MSDNHRTERDELARANALRIFKNSSNTSAKPWEPPAFEGIRREWFAQGFADCWNRTAIDDRTRSMVTIGVLAALGTETELKIHVDGALSMGITPEELIDVLALVGNYAGTPRAASALSALSRNLERRAGSSATTT